MREKEVKKLNWTKDFIDYVNGDFLEESDYCVDFSEATHLDFINDKEATLHLMDFRHNNYDNRDVPENYEIKIQDCTYSFTDYCVGEVESGLLDWEIGDVKLIKKPDIETILNK